MDDNILKSNNTTADSFSKPYLITHGKSDTEKEDEQSQTKRKYSNTSHSIEEQPNKRRCKAEKFEAIQYSIGPSEEYIAIKSYAYDIWERNKDNMSKIYQDIFSEKGQRMEVIMEYLVNISKRRAFWSLNEDILKINDSDNQYAISIKEDTAYSCLHSPKTIKERRSIRCIQKNSIRRIQDIVCEYSGRYQAWSLLQETLIRRIQSLGYTVSNRLPDPINKKLKNEF
ncbi:hypothetical protein Tco_1236304 [Tanacetum coccineum]